MIASLIRFNGGDKGSDLDALTNRFVSLFERCEIDVCVCARLRTLLDEVEVVDMDAPTASQIAWCGSIEHTAIGVATSVIDRNALLGVVIQMFTFDKKVCCRKKKGSCVAIVFLADTSFPSHLQLSVSPGQPCASTMWIRWRYWPPPAANCYER